MATVLVVDDNADLRFLTRRALESAGLQVRECESGVAALEQLSAGPLPDIVLLDIQMPVIDGWQTLEQIRREPRTAELPVVLCTVMVSPENRIKGLEHGCDGYVTKPFTSREIATQVLAALSRSHQERRRLRAAALAGGRQPAESRAEG